jgi:transposase
LLDEYRRVLHLTVDRIWSFGFRFKAFHFDPYAAGRNLSLPSMLPNPYLKERSAGKRRPAIRLENHRVHLSFDAPVKPVSGTQIVGADQGIATTLTLSDGQSTPSCPHGHTLSSIQSRLSRAKRGSQGFKRAQSHRSNYTGWALNQLDFSYVREVRLEKVRNIRRGRKCSRFLAHWTYTLIKQKLERLSETEGFRLREVSNEFRSQRCSSCGKVRKANRKGKTFKCDGCGFAADADLNAASNLRLDLFEIPWWVRPKQLNRKGFYWMPDGLFTLAGEPIVPQTTQP